MIILESFTAGTHELSELAAWAFAGLVAWASAELVASSLAVRAASSLAAGPSTVEGSRIKLEQSGLAPLQHRHFLGLMWL